MPRSNSIIMLLVIAMSAFLAALSASAAPQYYGPGSLETRQPTDPLESRQPVKDEAAANVATANTAAANSNLLAAASAAAKAASQNSSEIGKALSDLDNAIF